MRSISLRPPHIPCCSLILRAYARQSVFTVHDSHIDFALRSLALFASLRSKFGGGKKTWICGPRHAALYCHPESSNSALNFAPFNGNLVSVSRLGKKKKLFHQKNSRKREKMRLLVFCQLI